MLQAYSPTGVKIIGTLERVPGLAPVNGWKRDNETGTVFPTYAGFTELWWDDQYTVPASAVSPAFSADSHDDSAMCVDEDGGWWPQSKCTFREEGEPA